MSLSLSPRAKRGRPQRNSARRFKRDFKRNPKRTHLALAVIVLALVGLLVTGCGGSVGSSPSAAGASGGTSSTGTSGPQYLIKALDVDLAIKDTRQVATELEGWVAATDPHSETAGIDYQQTDTGFYHVSVTFSVQAALYPEIERYLAGYADQHGGKLLSLHETVQDVTNDYVDTQSRLANLRAEQQRLQGLIAQAGSLNDVLAIDQQLTNVEGQIEQIEAHLNELNSQTTYYRVTVALEPIEDGSVAAGVQFDPGGTLVSAAHAALIFGEFLITLLIWLLVFSVFVLPLLALWLLVRRRRRNQFLVSPAAPTSPARTATPVPSSVSTGQPSIPPSGPPTRTPPGPQSGPSSRP